MNVLLDYFMYTIIDLAIIYVHFKIIILNALFECIEHDNYFNYAEWSVRDSILENTELWIVNF